jgi:hypothetical protein
MESMIVAVFDTGDFGVAEYRVTSLASAQEIANNIPEGYCVRVFMNIYTIGRSSNKSRKIEWS